MIDWIVSRFSRCEDCTRNAYGHRWSYGDGLLPGRHCDRDPLSVGAVSVAPHDALLVRRRKLARPAAPTAELAVVATLQQLFHLLHLFRLWVRVHVIAYRVR